MTAYREMKHVFVPSKPSPVRWIRRWTWFSRVSIAASVTNALACAASAAHYKIAETIIYAASAGIWALVALRQRTRVPTWPDVCSVCGALRGRHG